MKKIKIIAIASLLISNIASSQSNQFLMHNGTNQSSPNNPTGVLDCDNGAPSILYQQPIDSANFATARSSDEELMFLVSESIVDGAGVITPLSNGISDSISFWGLSLELSGAGFIGTCSDDDLTPFNITFSADNAGLPGAVIASVVGVPSSIVDTAVPFAFTTIFKWDLSFPATDLTGAAWITIERQTGNGTAGGNQCVFLWLDESLGGSYDDQAIQDGGIVASDQVFCISESPPAPIAVPSLNLIGLILLLLFLYGSVLFIYRKT